jgi:hypothetical protein
MDVIPLVITLASVSSVAFQLTKYMILRASEMSINTVINKIDLRGNGIGLAQHVLMELDIESKMLQAEMAILHLQQTELGKQDAIKLCIENILDIMYKTKQHLRNVQMTLDIHMSSYFSSIRSLDLRDDLQALTRMCTVFDNRLQMLVFAITINKSANNALPIVDYNTNSIEAINMIRRRTPQSAIEF